MPHYLNEHIKAVGTFSLWKLTESEEELLRLRLLSEEENRCFALLKNKNRRREWLSCRIVLQNMLGRDFELYYLPNGKPVLRTPPFTVSISHSKNFAAVFISENKKVGIDIEKIRENIGTLKDRFLLPKEIQLVPSSDFLQLHLYWGAKEAMYKMYSEQQPLFTEHLSLSSIDWQQQKAIGHFHKADMHHDITVHFRQIEADFLVFCFES
jgi:4'-phosphopantetheinyl transferase EntD